MADDDLYARALARLDNHTGREMLEPIVQAYARRRIKIAIWDTLGPVVQEVWNEVAERDTALKLLRALLVERQCADALCGDQANWDQYEKAEGATDAALSKFVT